MLEKVALAASGAWVGTTSACVICSIITFLAARLPMGRGVGSTTMARAVGFGAFGTGVDAALAALVAPAPLAATGAVLDLAGRVDLVGDVVGVIGFLVAVLAGAFTTACLAPLVGLLAGKAFLIGVAATDFFGADLAADLGAATLLAMGAFATTLELVLATDLTTGAFTGFLAATTARAEPPDFAAPTLFFAAAGADFFAWVDLVAGTFTTGLLLVPDDTSSWSGVLPGIHPGLRRLQAPAAPACPLLYPQYGQTSAGRQHGADRSPRHGSGSRLRARL
ncbi:hypothetical protein [Hydrogenophaga sp.]|uniref:hypothetical protein n=1 Tax=Hydrogenophaga sp. TaxID=1904254 RepID=UPI003567C49A